MAEVAKLVELIVRPDGSADLRVDGVEFPWDVTWDSVSIYTDQGQRAQVTVTILADRTVTSLQPASVQTAQVENSEPKMWEVGWRFTFDEVYGDPPKKVKRLREVDTKHDYPVLARRDSGWSWFTEDGQPFATGDVGLPWSDWSGTFGDKEFEVIEVKSE